MNEITVKTARGDFLKVKTSDRPQDALTFLQEVFPQMKFEANSQTLKGAA